MNIFRCIMSAAINVKKEVVMSNGLEEVIAADTRLSDVDGGAGRLVIRGHSLADLAGRWSCEQVVALLFEDFFADLPDEEALRTRLGAARRDVQARLSVLLPALAARGAYDGLRAGIALLPDGHELDDALRLVAAPAVLIPAILRLRAGAAPLAPDADLPHAADMLRMLSGELSAARASALETYLSVVCDHGLNASTFATRVVASTGAGLTSGVLAGLGALKGPLHGGAPGPVIEMLDAIADDGDARAWLSDLVRSGERIMGFGHRIYRVRDPRADALKAAVLRLAGDGENARLRFAEQVESSALAVLRELKPRRPLQTNVEFYTALLLEAVGFPPEAFTGVFAAGRMTGWLAHAREQALTGRLIRPKSRYIGPEVDMAA
jgi:citrate synthase